MFWPDEIPTNTDVHALKMFLFCFASIFVLLQWVIAGLYDQACKTFVYFFLSSNNNKTNNNEK